MADFTQNGGSNGGTYAKYYTGKLSVWENSYDISSNTSNVGYRLQLISGSSGQFSGLNASYSITINGQQVKNGSSQYSLGHNGTITFAEGTMTVGHNTDGTKSISCSATIDFQSHSASPGDFYPSGNLELAKIPRYATVSHSLRNRAINRVEINWSATAACDWTQYSLNGGEWTDTYNVPASDNKSGYYPIDNLSPNTKYTIKTRCKRRDSQLWSETSVLTITTYDIAKLTSTSNINIGSAHNITWTNPSGASTSLKLCKTDNSTIIDYGTVTGTSKSITPTANTIYALTPNSNTYKARYIITTTANGKSYTNSKDFTFTVTNSNPTFSNFTYQDTNATITALTGNNQILVNGYSNVKATVSTSNKAVAKNSATMKTYKLAIGNKNISANYNASADINLSINSINNNVIDLYAIDSRGNSTKVSKTATIKNYSNIKIKSLSVARQNNVGTVTTLKFEGEFWNASFGSVTNVIASCKYKYKLTSSSSWTDGKTTLTYDISGNKITGSLNIQGDKGTDGFSADNSYNIQLTISDKLSTATSTIILASGNPAIAIYKNNIAIGQQYDTSEGSKLQVNGDIKANNFKGNATNVNQKKTLSSKSHSNFGTNNGYLPDMSFIAYWNGAYSNSNASNLTYCYQGEIQAKPKTLYDNSSGTTGTVTLSESAANFSYLEIFAGRSDRYYSTKVQAANGKKVLLTTSYFADNLFYIYSKKINISGTSITTEFSKICWTGNSENASLGDDNAHKIFKIIGYR